ncbi:hypothetical protein TcBrA4_0091870 [Trypanosoma cruzi]|nr:hypothetical protein TcBrA4_0091870 [Trypanosoma cruzi]
MITQNTTTRKRRGGGGGGGNMSSEVVEESWLVYFLEQGWLPFFIMGVIILGLRMYNVRQREEQRQLLREGLLSELNYQKILSKRHRE